MESKNIATQIIIELRKVRRNKDFALEDQVRRSAISIASNIAEGFDRDSNNEFIRFLRIAKGSCSELITQIEIMKELNYLDINFIDNNLNKISIVGSRIGKLIRYLNNNGKQH